MRPRRYYHYVHKDEQVLSKIWRVLHFLVFLAICLSSLIGSEAFCNIFDIFNYRCILYAKARTTFVDVIYKNRSDVVDNNTESEIIEVKNETELNYLKLNLGLEEKDYEMEMFSNGIKFDINKATKIPGTKDMYIMNEEIWIDNENFTGRAHVGMTTTIFESLYLCDFIVLIPFVSVIVSVCFALVVMLFSRTGKGSLESIPPAFLYVYPLIITASIMSVLSIITYDLISNGLDVFCKHFAKLTGQIKCSPFMDYFTKEQKRGYRHFYHYTKVSRIAYLLAPILWICQVIVALVRILSGADYNLITVLIKSKSKWHEDDDEDILLERWDKEPAPQLAAVVESFKNDNKEV